MSDRNSEMNLIVQNLLEGRKSYWSENSKEMLSLHYTKLLNLKIYDIFENKIALFYYALVKQLKSENYKEKIVNLSLRLKNFRLNEFEGKKKINNLINLFKTVALPYRNRIIKKMRLLEQTLINDSPNFPEYYLQLSKFYEMINDSQRSNEFIEIYNEKLSRLNDIDLIFQEVNSEFEAQKQFLTNFISSRKYYKKILDKNNGIFNYFRTLTKLIADSFSGKKNPISLKKVPEVINDLLKCLEWISIISSLIFYIFKFDKGDDLFFAELINIIEENLGQKPPELIEDQETLLFNNSIFNKETFNYLLKDFRDKELILDTEGLKIYSLGNVDKLPAKEVMILMQNFIEENKIPLEKVRVFYRGSETILVVEEKKGTWEKYKNKGIRIHIDDNGNTVVY